MGKPIHVMHVLGNLGVGGAETGVLRLIQGLSSDPDLRHSIMIAGRDRSLMDSMGIDVPTYSLGLEGRSYSAFLRMTKLFRTRRVGIVHVNNLACWPDAALASRLSGCRCIETFHGIEDPNLSFSLAKKMLYKAAKGLSARVTAVSEEAAELLTSITGVDQGTVQLIPNGVDTDRFRPASSPEAKQRLRQQKGLPSHGILVGCVAALRPVKNHAGLLEALGRIMPGSRAAVFLALVGDGPLRRDLENLAREMALEDRVLFLGKRTDVADLLRCFDLFVLNSLTEGLSYALLEAMASGLPVVATAVGAAVRLIDDGRQGFLVAPKDTEALAQALKKLLDDPLALQRMGKEARKTVESEYGINKMLERYRALYMEVGARR